MAEVLRLLRLSLILRVAISVFAGVVGGMVTGANTLITLPLVLPSCILLVVTIVALQRGRTDARFVNGVLVAVIVAQSAEEVGMRLLLHTGVFTPPGVDFPRGPRSPVDLLFSRNIFGGALLAAIPAILGAWISGKRGAIKWAIFATSVSAVGDLITIVPNFELLRFISGSIASQGMVITLLAFFVG